MENASKALIMAAEILIAMIILSIAVYLIMTFGNFSKQVHDQNAELELQNFNSQFIAYQNMDNITIHDVITVANYAKENNEKYELDNSNRNKESTYYVTVTLNGENQPIEDKQQPDFDEFVKQDMEGIKTGSSNLPTYNCKVSISEVTGRVYKVNFTE